MPPTASEPATDLQDLSEALKTWCQGDYFLCPAAFVEIDTIEGNEFGPAVIEDVIGLVVVTQTCDIVNPGPGRESVVVCPLKEVTESYLNEIKTGRTPGAALLEHAPSPNLVVDIGRMMSIRKEVLAKVIRHAGFTSDTARSRFAKCLERKHGRFAFPDVFNDQVLRPLKQKIQKYHPKSESEHGKCYRSIKTARVRAAPSWEDKAVVVCFYFVLEDEEHRQTTRNKINETVGAHINSINWPDGFSPETLTYWLMTMDEMTARQWEESQPIDWDFLSSRFGV